MKKTFLCLILSSCILIFTSFTVPWIPGWISNRTQQKTALEPRKAYPPQISENSSLGIYHVAYPYEYHFLLDRPTLCLEEKPLLLLMVPVAPRNRAARDAIRKTWGNHSLVLGWRVQTLFMLGLSKRKGGEMLQRRVQQESEAHHDLLQADFLDSYHNLTIKTMLMMEWLSSRCPRARYAMKVDTDVFLNVHNLVKMLQHSPKKNFITGHLERSSVVQRRLTAKWYVPREIYKPIRYPPYINGHGYVFSMDLPTKIVSASKHIKAFYLEDVYVGMCLKYLRIRPTAPAKPLLFASIRPRHLHDWNGIFFLLRKSYYLLRYWKMF